MLGFVITLAIAAFLGVDARAMQYTFETKLDHNDPYGEKSEKFKMRYLVDDQYYNDGKMGNMYPIFFYAGNEGDVWSFYENSGFMTETLAKKFGALVVFGEHRYFG